jgi:NitT/TauT family transport system substrate-binding protein
MGLVKLIDDAESGLTSQHYLTTVYGTPDEVVPLIVQGEIDIALIPANLASVLFNKTKDTDAAIAVAAINTLGVLEVVEAGDSISDIGDLQGRTIYSTGKGTTPEYVLNYVLTQNGLTPGTDVTVEFLSEATEVAARLATEPGAVGVLPQPYVTVLQAKDPSVRSALSLTEEWDSVSPGSPLVTGVVIVRQAFAQDNPEAFAQFLADYEVSTQFTNDFPADAAPLIVAAGIAPNDAVAEAAIPRCNIVFMEGEDLRAALDGYLNVLFAADPASVGGSVPGDDFYYDD